MSLTLLNLPRSSRRTHAAPMGPLIPASAFGALAPQHGGGRDGMGIPVSGSSGGTHNGPGVAPPLGPALAGGPQPYGQLGPYGHQLG